MKTKIKVIVLKDFIVFLPFVLLAVFLIGIHFFFASPLNHNNQGVKFLKKKDFESAIEAFSRAIDKTYFNPSPQLNLALSYDLHNKPLKALDIYSSTSKKFKGLTQFYSHFNQGELKGRLGKTEEALESYQAALEFHREEKKIKENIEWLFFKNEKKKKENQKEEEQKNKQKREKGESQENKNTKSSPEDQHERKQEDGSQNTKEKEQSRENKEEKQENTDNTKSSSENQQEEISESKKKDTEEFNENKKKAGEKNEEPLSKDVKGSEEKFLNEMERKAILNSIEKQESDIRMRQFQNKSQKQKLKPGEKDW